ncbi:hypothetical protein NG2371_05536 [Nocardia gamkensis]|uniref:DNA-directed RNA polymerase subunit beta n=2 Tax=Nocardia gamkensis TaxID=352869 RepID=A0A7X6L9Z2_9NOCA|nr:DNA-directed RNA polymerase subunit beta [Nocardia gamkensis]NQE71065.1 hypothetical protein [Nocardia gamkensis]
MVQIAFGRTPLSRCAYYRQVCDLPAEVDPPQVGRIVLGMGVAWAVIMPATLGQDVKVWMQRHHHRIGPIMSHPRSKRWTYLTQPDLPDDIMLFAEMFRLDVSLVRAGATVALPSPADRGTTFRAWIARPDSAFRPSGSVVVAAIRGCVAERIARRKRGFTYA